MSSFALIFTKTALSVLCVLSTAWRNERNLKQLHPVFRYTMTLARDRATEFVNSCGDLLNPAWAESDVCLNEFANFYATAEPFPHVVIDNFLNEDVARQIEACFPSPHKNQDMTWYVYNNPIECKFACDTQSEFPDAIRRLFDLYKSQPFLDLIKRITNIQNLEHDPYLHGAGLHYHPTGSKLDMHLDYSIHPHSGKERRVNLILYLNDSWPKAWGGHLDLHNHDQDGNISDCAKRIAPAFNRAVLFRTTDISWHGLPDGVNCPLGDARKSVAVYYVSDPRPDATLRNKADYRARPEDEANDDEGVKALRRIRPFRRILKSDIDRLVPSWRSPMESYLRQYRPDLI